MHEIFLKPGGFVAVDEPTQLKTILGSCVAVALFDEGMRVAGLNHFLLPSAPAHIHADERGRYADTAIACLVTDLIKLGARRERLQAFLIGGGAVISVLANDFKIGELNVAAARQALAQWRIGIRHEDVGGDTGRHLCFNTMTLTTNIRKIARQGA